MSEVPVRLDDTRNRPLRDLRISVTDRCNFRCPYCMPAEVYGEGHSFLPRAAILSFEEIARLARIFAELGVAKLRISGGEPLLRRDLSSLVARLEAIPGIVDLALTTNAVRLPVAAEALRKAGLRRVTVSLDSLDPEVFRRMNGGRGEVEEVLDGLRAAERAGFAPIKINCVVQRGVNEAGLVALARHFRGTGHILRFIEYMDVGTMNGWDRSQVVPASEILDRVGSDWPLEPIAPGYRGEVASRYRYRDGGGEIGVIASVSQPFCAGCTRARLTTDGQLVTCLFAPSGFDLRAPLRDGASDAQLRDLVSGVWRVRRDRYSEERSATPTARDRIEMYQIGG